MFDEIDAYLPRGHDVICIGVDTALDRVEFDLGSLLAMPRPTRPRYHASSPVVTGQTVVHYHNAKPLGRRAARRQRGRDCADRRAARLQRGRDRAAVGAYVDRLCAGTMTIAGARIEMGTLGWTDLLGTGRDQVT